MKKLIILFIAAFLLASCAPTPSTPPPGAVDTAVAKTFAAWTAAAPQSTNTPIPTNTTPSSDTPIPTDTLPPPTDTPSTPFPAGAECIPTGTERTEAQVARVIDGDTIDVDIGGQSFRVRYIGMDTPEDTSQIEYFGPEATAFNAQLVEGKQVTLVKDVSETDRYDRLLRYVIAGDFFVNYELVRQGFATGATFPPDVACQDVFREAERTAREESKGLWGATPTPLPTNTSVPLPTNTPRPLPTATSAPPQSADCDPAYPTVCIPSPPPDLDCGDISFRRFQVLPPDPHRFDGDHDGIGCES
jgi:micrococcal nuclease